jgi:copper(I)-binding protein
VRRALLALLAGVWALIGCGGDDDEPGAGNAPVTVTDAWARSTSAAQTTGAVYFSVESDSDDTLVSASVPSSIAARAELHEQVANDDGSMVMRALTDGLALTAGQPAVFEPGGLHVMLVDLAAPLVIGATFDLTLGFDHADAVSVPVTVYETEP